MNSYEKEELKGLALLFAGFIIIGFLIVSCINQAFENSPPAVDCSSKNEDI
jgi:hypothetical protein